jgi:hypothetical protein
MRDEVTGVWRTLNNVVLISFALITRWYWDDQTMKHVIGRVCSMNRGSLMNRKCLLEMKGTDHLGERIILSCI